MLISYNTACNKNKSKVIYYPRIQVSGIIDATITTPSISSSNNSQLPCQMRMHYLHLTYTKSNAISDSQLSLTVSSQRSHKQVHTP